MQSQVGSTWRFLDQVFDELELGLRRLEEAGAFAPFANKLIPIRVL